MNKRQKKKLFKKVVGNNPRIPLNLHSECYHHIIGKPYGGTTERAKRQQETIKNLHGFIQAMTERRTQ